MREYDDHIRLYTPILQRIIILVAVIIAVPVVLWTITAFVRAYVAPPQLPMFRPMTAACRRARPLRPRRRSNRRFKSRPRPPSPTTATDARGPMLDIKKPAGSDPPQAAAPPPATQQAALATAATPPAPACCSQYRAYACGACSRRVRSAAAAVCGDARRAGDRGRSAPMSRSPMSRRRQLRLPPGPIRRRMRRQIPDRTPAGAPSRPQEQTAANDSAADDLPAGVPLKGKIPLPPHRPKMAALTNVALAGEPDSAQRRSAARRNAGRHSAAKSAAGIRSRASAGQRRALSGL